LSSKFFVNLFQSCSLAEFRLIVSTLVLYRQSHNTILVPPCQVVFVEIS
jgi:hypothetical protein